MSDNRRADISVFESIQATQNAKFGITDPMAVFNAYSEEEIQQRIKQCEAEINGLQQELKQKQSAALQAHNRYKFSAEEFQDYREYKLEVQDKIAAFENRIAQLKNNDPEGRFADQCFAIETKLKEFKAQTGLPIDKPQ